MTALLEKAIGLVSALPPHQQESIAALILDELESERRWDAQFAGSQDALARLAGEASGEDARGETREWKTPRDLADD